MTPSTGAILILFLSTLSLRRATGHAEPMGRAPRISIHALLAESDIVGTSQVFQRIAFLSTLSLRRATHFIKDDVSYNIFLSTLSLRRATRR